jgi:hypothetical protein
VSVQKVCNISQAWKCTAVIPIFRRLGQQDNEFETSLGYIVRPCLEKTNKQKVWKIKQFTVILTIKSRNLKKKLFHRWAFVILFCLRANVKLIRLLFSGGEH